MANLYIGWPEYYPNSSLKVKEGLDRLSRLAFVENNGEAFWALGLLYEHGIQTEVNYNKAVEYFEKAVSLGYIDAEKNLTNYKKTFLGEYKKIR